MTAGSIVGDTMSPTTERRRYRPEPGARRELLLLAMGCIEAEFLRLAGAQRPV